MDKIYDVAVIVGSLRKDSINRKVANALAELAPDHLGLRLVELGRVSRPCPGGGRGIVRDAGA